MVLNTLYDAMDTFFGEPKKTLHQTQLGGGSYGYYMDKKNMINHTDQMFYVFLRVVVLLDTVYTILLEVTHQENSEVNTNKKLTCGLLAYCNTFQFYLFHLTILIPHRSYYFDIEACQVLINIQHTVSLPLGQLYEIPFNITNNLSCVYSMHI